MQPLEFSCEQIIFSYQQKGHLASKFTLRNRNSSLAYFKFKLTRPKYYLLKPDRGFIEPGQTIHIDITLHSEGIPEAENDKIKCFYRLVGRREEPPKDWEHDEIESYNVRLPVVVNNLPEQMRRVDEGIKASEVKSLANSKFDGKVSQSPLESSIKEKEAKLQSLRTQVDSLKRTSSTPQPSLLTKEYLLIAGAGLVVGLLSSLWI